MKAKTLFLVATLMAMAQGAWAQTTVKTDQELRAAIQINNVDIKLLADLNLSNSTLNIAEGMTVTIDLDGHALDRKLTKRGEGGGQVITVREGATLNLKNGTLKGGWGGNGGGLVNEGGTVTLTDVNITGNTADDRGGGISNQGTLTMTGGSITSNTSKDGTDTKGGGGIMNSEGATATLTNVTITGNEARVTGGGGICNYGTLTLDGCTIQDNIAKQNGGGIWIGSKAVLDVTSITVTGNKAGENGGGIYGNHSFSMQGVNTITDNTGKDGMANNVYLMWNQFINVTGAITGSRIGVTLGTNVGGITNGFNKYTDDPSLIFLVDDDVFHDLGVDSSNEVIIIAAYLIYPVTKDSELRKAIQIADANIKLAADIDLSNSTLSIGEGMTVNINLDGHTLDRKLTKRGENGGQVITVRKNATLNLSNGTLKGGWGGNGGGLVNEGGTVTLTDVNITGNTADDRGGGISNHGTLTMTGGSISGNTTNDQTAPEGGGGIMNSEGATATLTNVSITGNTVKVKGGGGICNYGTMTMDGCTVTGNSCQLNGGGIWNKGTLNMQGVMTVTGNTTANSVTNNLFLKTGAIINVTNALTGSNVGIIMETPGVFTSGYSTYHSGTDPATFFTSDEAQFLMMPAGEEAGLAVHYIERSWDKDNHTVVNHDRTVAGGHYTVLSSKNGDKDVVTLGDGVYVVRGSININNIKCTGAVKLVLCDDSRLEVKNGIRVDDFKDYGSIFIYSQSYGDAMGKIRTTVTDDDFHGSALGAGSGNHLGPIEIHGGDIRAEGRDGDETWVYEDYWNYQSGTGIGGSTWNDGNYITIYGGKIEAIAYYEECAIGLGGCYYYNKSDPKGCVITIYDGDITATANGNGAGIGNNCIYNNDHGAINIHGGHVVAKSTENGAGIGGGGRSYSGDILITGGEVHAYGGNNGAGIGCGSESILNEGLTCNTVTITGGTVYAYGGTDAAGIGGGEDGDGGTIKISGGYVYAEGKDYGAGIGGGQEGKGAKVTITGGTVIAKAGRDETGMRAIGPGEDCDDYGSLTIGDGMMVSSERFANKDERKNMCWYRTQARIEPCSHQGGTFANHHDGSHTISGCNYCSAATEPHTYDENNECTRCAEEKIYLADNADNTDIINASQGQERTVVLDGRTLYKNGNWNTLCLPFNVSALEGSPLAGATVKTLNKASFANGTLTMNFSSNDLTSLEAGKPYLVKWEKDKNAVLIIRNYVDWNAFADMVEGGADYSGKTVLLADDIEVDEMVGTSGHPFRGTFDGNGHTLTFYQNATEKCAAPFRYAKNATICNLTVKGHITTSAKCAAGFIGRSFGTVNINNCRSSVKIESSIDLTNSKNGDGTHAGFIASIDEGSATLTNCLFDGKLLGEGSNRWGGLVGWKSTYNAAKANFNNCFFNPSEVTFSRTLSYTIVRSETWINYDIYNTYYKTSYSCAYVQGINAADMSNGELLSALGDGWEISGGKVLPKKVYDSNIVNPLFEGVTISNTQQNVSTDYVDFCGTYVPVGFQADDQTMLYIGTDNKLHYPDDAVTINALHSYFLLKGLDKSTLPADNIMMNFSMSHGPTGIEVMSDGRGKMSDVWYDLQGRKLNSKPTQKGVYINNGKKITIE